MVKGRESGSDGPEIKATLQSSRIILDAMLRRSPKPNDVEWFIYHMDDLLQFSGRKQTTQNLHKIIKTMKQAKGKIHEREIHADFYPLARQALRLIDEILKS